MQPFQRASCAIGSFLSVDDLESRIANCEARRQGKLTLTGKFKVMPELAFGLAAQER
jgi:hypothetical protein